MRGIGRKTYIDFFSIHSRKIFCDSIDSKFTGNIENIFRFSETEIKDIMTPRPEIIWVDENTSLNSFLKIYKKNPHTRFPVCKDSLDEVVGIISVKDVMF